MRPGIRAAVVMLITAVLAVPLVSTDVAQAEPVEPDQVGLVDPGTGEWHLRGTDGFTTSFYFGNPGDYPSWVTGTATESIRPACIANPTATSICATRIPRVSPIFASSSGTRATSPWLEISTQTDATPYPSTAKARAMSTSSTSLGRTMAVSGRPDYDYYFGNPGDKPFASDFNGDHIDTVGLHRESTGLVYYRNTNTQGIADDSFIFGDPGDRMIAGDWTGDGVDTVGLFRPVDFTFYLRNENTEGNADEQIEYGIPRMIPVVGTFNIPATTVADRDWSLSTVVGTRRVGSLRLAWLRSEWASHHQPRIDE